MGVGYWPDLSSGSLVRHILEDAFAMQNAALIRRSALFEVGSFSEGMQRSLDYDMFVRLACSFPAKYVDILSLISASIRVTAGLRQCCTGHRRRWRSGTRTTVQSSKIYTATHRSRFSKPCSTRRPSNCGPAPPSCSARCHGTARLLGARVRGLGGGRDDGEDTIDAGEYRICLRALSGKHEPAGLCEKDVLGHLSGLSKDTDVGRQSSRPSSPEGFGDCDRESEAGPDISWMRLELSSAVASV